jgi:hypothetical protein
MKTFGVRNLGFQTSNAQRFASRPVRFSQGTARWAGVDSAWEQENPEARKMPVNRPDSHTSGARFVRRAH